MNPAVVQKFNKTLKWGFPIHESQRDKNPHACLSFQGINTSTESIITS